MGGQFSVQMVGHFWMQFNMLYFDRSGYCIWSKRLEQGRFQSRSGSADKVLLSWTQLKLILEGIELKNTRQYKRFQCSARGR